MSSYQTKFHRDGSVTVCNVYLQQWQRTFCPSGDVLASLSAKERDRVIRHCKIRKLADLDD